MLLIAFLVGLFFLAADGQSRLNAANERVHNSQLRQQALSEFIALMTDAESGQRGYLLTGEIAYLQPYTEAVANVEAALDRVHEAYGGNDDSREFHELRILTGKKLGELDDTLALFKKRGPAPAVNVVRTDVGRRTMDEIAKIVGAMRLAESRELAAGHRPVAGGFSPVPLGVDGGRHSQHRPGVAHHRLVYGDMRRRARQSANLRDQKQELEHQVDERTRELTALSTHLQGVSERKSPRSRAELHDELGGLLVAARMDLSWLQQRLPTNDPSIEQRFKRIHESLSSGVDLKRRVVEELRPTLLDNMGLFAAVRWQFKETCRRAGLKCTEAFPDEEPKFNPEAAIGVFRIAQEAMTNILKHAEAKSADLSIRIDGDVFVLRVSDDGKGIPPARLQTTTSHGLASMRHRVAALGGTWEMRSPGSGGTVVTTVIPLSRMLSAQLA